MTIQLWHTPDPIWNQSVVSCPVLTVAFWPAYRFLKGQVRWSGIPMSFRIFHSLLWSTQSKALVPGASVRNPAHGKGHEEGGLAYAKVGASLRGPLEILKHLPPKPESAYLTALCFHLHFWHYEGLSPTTSLWKGISLGLQLINLLGVTRVFQSKNSSDGSLAWQVYPATCDFS